MNGACKRDGPAKSSPATVRSSLLADLVALVVRGPSLVRRNPGLPGELLDVLVRALGELRGNPGADINGASLPAMTLDRHRRRRLEPQAMHGANVADNLRLAEFVHRRRAPLPCRPGRFAAAGSGDKSTFAGV
jgi:hypothetical protein